MDELPKRTPTRVKNFDYSTPGAYFVTICTEGRKQILSNITVGDGVYDIPCVRLTHIGKIVDKYINVMNETYDNVSVEKYVIMPNHIHMIISILPENPTNGLSQAPNPTNAIIPKFVSLFKRYCNREIGHSIFQRSYHDHIIRGVKDYTEIYTYIESNPAKWAEDCYYQS